MRGFLLSRERCKLATYLQRLSAAWLFCLVPDISLTAFFAKCFNLLLQSKCQPSRSIVELAGYNLRVVPLLTFVADFWVYKRGDRFLHPAPSIPLWPCLDKARKLVRRNVHLRKLLVIGPSQQPGQIVLGQSVFVKTNNICTSSRTFGVI